MFQIKLPRGFALQLTRAASRDVHVRPEGDPERMDDPFELFMYRRRDLLNQYLEPEPDRKRRIRTYEDMDNTDMVSAVLDLFAEDATQPHHDTGRRIWVSSEYGPILEQAEHMMAMVKAEEEIPQIARELCKFGDDFERVVYEPGMGVVTFVPTDPKAIVRIQDEYQRLQGFREEQQEYLTAVGKKSDVSNPWDYVHFRLRGRDRRQPYGDSILFPAIRPWRSVVLGEDHALMYRLTRAPDRLAFLIDVGTAARTTHWSIVNEFRKRFKKWEFLDPTTGRYDNRFNPITPLEDIFLPISGDSKTRVEKMPGSPNNADVSDLIYFLAKFFAAVRVPPAFMGYGNFGAGGSDVEGLGASPNKGLTQQYIRFANAIKRVQLALCRGFRTAIEVHLRLLTANPEDLTYDPDVPGHEFEVLMTTPSALDDTQRMDVETLRTGLASTMLQLGLNNPAIDLYNWTVWVLKEVYRFDEERLKSLISRERLDAYQNRDGELPQAQKAEARAVVAHMRPLLKQVRQDIEDRAYADLDTTNRLPDEQAAKVA